MTWASIIVGVVSTAVGTGVNAAQAKAADNAQASNIMRQRQQAQTTRAMTERRQAWLAKQMESDEALRMKGEQRLNQTIEDQSAETTKKGVEEETARLTDVLGGKDAQNQVMQQISSVSQTPDSSVASTVMNDRTQKAALFGGQAQDRMGSLAKNLAWDTFGDRQNTALMRGQSELGLWQNMRRGNMDAYRRQMQTLMAGEDAGNAATNALSGKLHKVDTTMGDIFGGVGGMALSYGMGQLGRRNSK